MTQTKKQVKDAITYFEKMGFIEELTSDKRIFVQELINYAKENMDMDRDEVYDAKQILKKAGYQTELILNTSDITYNFHCSEDMAEQILEESFDEMENLLWSEIVDKCNYYEIKHKG